jgi:hypothetical protein
MKMLFGSLCVATLAMTAQPASAALFGGPDAVIQFPAVSGCPAVPPAPPEPAPAPAAVEAPPAPVKHPRHQAAKKKPATVQTTSVSAPKP